MVGAAKKRLKWDEAFAVQLSLVQRKLRAASAPAIRRPPRPEGLLSTFDSTLPYRLTQGQVAVGAQIAEDLTAAHPMHRLLQGEVGSGKTVCALRGDAAGGRRGRQAALLAPTEVLAAQHYRSVRDLLGPMGAAVSWTAPIGYPGRARDRLPAAAVRRALARRRRPARPASSSAPRPALRGVDFADLGLVVVDEQHRFGVEQRDACGASRWRTPARAGDDRDPDPAHRGDDGLRGPRDFDPLRAPAGRSPIRPTWCRPRETSALARAWRRLREEVEAGHQAYVVCPRIGGEPATARTLRLLWTIRGRRPRHRGTRCRPAAGRRRVGGTARRRAARSATWRREGCRDARFRRGKLDVLVATTVIEVGVDVPNATMMVVLDADRFGVSQLHQLRGRVGRGSAPGCACS
jgi:ATP-dependent DNA helicase RecG